MIKLRVGFEMVYDCPQPTPMVLNLHVHSSRSSDVIGRDDIFFDPELRASEYLDRFGNWCTRIVAPAGRTRMYANSIVSDSGLLDAYVPEARQTPVNFLPDDTLVYLLGSRYCETDLLTAGAWALFGNAPTGWARVQAICDYVHNHITFGYQHARMTRTAAEAHNDRVGVCRDYAHLAITLCRCMNIPARYCTGYLGDIRIPPIDAPMDFAAWMEVFLDGSWYTFDARNNTRRTGRVLIARGRDASDVALTTIFGPNTLYSFNVIAEEIAM
jgi:transglutaminase-like putative cysteine protease